MMPGTSQPRLGTVERAGDRYVLRYERSLPHPVARVWAALTEPAQLAGWLAAADELELAEGGRVALRWLNAPDVVARGRVTRFHPPAVLEFDTDFHGVMRWELRPDGDGCVLTFVNTVAFPEGHPPEQTLAGWHIHLDHLAEALAGRPVAWSTWTEDHLAGWARIRDRYSANVAEE